MHTTRPYVSSVRFSQGFTMLEMSIVLLILALMAGGILSLMTQTVRVGKTADLQKKMDAIEEALIDFRKKNNRIPCPADATILTTVVNFGIEGATPGTCTGGTPAANFTDGSNTVGGVVPTKTLGLPDDYMFDPWGGRFTYIADKRATGTNAFTTYVVTDTTIGSITVQDTSGANRTANAVAVIISHGPNGHGAYQLGGVRKSSGSTNTNELLNCHCTNTAANGTFTNVTVMQANSASSTDVLNNFDDTLRYYTRAALASSGDLLTETR